MPPLQDQHWHKEVNNVFSGHRGMRPGLSCKDQTTGGMRVSGEDSIFVGGGGEAYALPQSMLLKYGNRHGLIAGATGTGKTVTLQVLAEGFSAAGVPVFLSDVKGDL